MLSRQPTTEQSNRLMTDAAAQVQKLLRQQAAIARFGSFALRERDLIEILTEAARVFADGLNVPFSTVCPYPPRGERSSDRRRSWLAGRGRRSCGVARRYELAAG